ncbi:ribonuclease HII [Candidatus Daviesbacteria bacterium]|nr:ribonuclease HII [Candidatus Daviesbacteria bacterium]
MVYANCRLEERLWQKGFQYVCGMDEVGRGCFAGPVVVGAVVFSPDSKIPVGIADSKLLKPQVREKLAEEIKQVIPYCSTAVIGVDFINKFGIGKATMMAFRKAVKLLAVNPDHILVDAFYIDHLDRIKQTAVKDGDTICSSIAAASIIAKVYRDKLMEGLHEKYPQYGFAIHKGYGTKKHQEAIKIHGLSKIHRTSFNLTKFLAV